MDWTTIMLTASLILNAFLLNIIAQQAKDMSALKRKQLHTEPIVQDAEFHASIKEKIDTIGMIPTVKFLRETYDLSLLEAKQLVDRVNERE
ncbi:MULTISPECIES: hypothetical protein [Exiguobacterium]|uniref:hypothetical protein n=1 Tax=Exiguobacterium TaxID=33986 RepID=UPI00103ABD94|nr:MULTISPECIES: hypothetical protein [unclassified Exiguobacterium]TCI67463.1 hypothetical protein EVJ19_12945 [Exiguobacterium sp. IPCI3]TCI76801.1 hypothetical protein EVJ18_12935 [Exiguobacterium sp. IPCH1]TCI78546.1 hypothetical protein EVJ17_12935 [Exiguobacterium sp. IPBC4]